ncbi:hypothetical protein C0J52_05799 [Blattella germanica]|nr:hypothetical protein C0J52_05799 [Blattella germanica]
MDQKPQLDTFIITAFNERLCPSQHLELQFLSPVVAFLYILPGSYTLPPTHHVHLLSKGQQRLMSTFRQLAWVVGC